MDPVTHALIAAVITQVVADRAGHPEPPPGWMLSSILVAQAPDIDCVTYLLDPGMYLAYHRGVTHSIPGAALALVLLWFLCRRLFPGEAHRGLFLAWAMAWLSHGTFDLMTAYGTGILEPFSAARYTLAWLFIFDPFFFLILALALWVGKARRTALACLAGGYLLVQAGLTARADRCVAAVEPRARSFPMFLDPVTRMAPFRDGLRAGELIVDPLRGRILARRDLAIAPEAAERELRALASWPGTAFAAWSSHPFPIWSPEKGRLEVSDLRFQPVTGRRVFVLRQDERAGLELFHHVPAGEALLPPPPLAWGTGL